MMMTKKSFSFKIEEMKDISQYYLQDKNIIAFLDKISQIMFFILLFFSLPLALISREITIFTGIFNLILLFLYICVLFIPYKAKVFLSEKELPEIANHLIKLYENKTEILKNPKT